MIRLKELILAIFAAFLMSGLAGADILYLKNGNKLEGRIVSESEIEVALETPAGTVTLHTADIERIERKISPIEDYEKTLATLEDDDSVGHYYLGVWCKRQGLRRQAEAQFRKVISINPDYREAREELGYVMHAGEWVTQDESMRAKGFVRYEGRWLTQAEAEELMREDTISEETARLRRAARLLEGNRQDEGKAVFAEFAPQAEEPFDEAVAVPVLRNLAEHKSAAVRTEVIELLGQWRTERAFDALVELLLNEAEREVALATVMKLKEVNSLRAARELVRVSRDFRRMLATADDAQKRSLVINIQKVSWALGIIGEPLAVPELADSLRLEVNYVQRVPARLFGGPGTGTLEPVPGTDISTATTSGVSISTSREQVLRFVLNDYAAESFRQITGERSYFDRMKMLEWWARHKPVLPPEEHEFEL